MVGSVYPKESAMKAWNWLLVVALMGFGLSACGSGGGASCGDGVVDDGETCDDGLDNSDTTVDACRTDCTAAACGDSVQDTGEQCDDGNTTDGDDCSATCLIENTVCGDDVVEGFEECEPNIDDDCHPAGHVSECTFVRSAFRMKSLTLIDPTIKFSPTCNAGIHPLVNDGLTEATVEDKSTFAPPESLDGLIDLGFVFTFGPPNQGNGQTINGAFVISDCDRLDKPSPVPNPSPCSPTIVQESSSTTFSATTQTTGNCLEVLPDTTTQTVDPVEPGDFGCWASPPVDFTVVLGSVVQIPLSEVVIAAQWDADPADNVVSGLIRGFMTEADAIATVIDPSTTFIGGQSLKDSFGHDGSAPGDCDERDDNNGVLGYWVYLGFEAESVPWEGGPMCGNGVVDTGGEERDELCDTGIASGEGSCEALLDCDDSFACTQDTLNAGDACAPRCFNRAIQLNDDDCCPALAPEGTEVLALNSPKNDSDCVALCDNGTLEAFEVCDTTEGTACDDPIALCVDDGDACTVETGDLVLIGTNLPLIKNICVECPQGTCECKRTTIGQRIPDDGCCPAVCQGGSPPANCADDTDCT